MFTLIFKQRGTCNCELVAMVAEIAPLHRQGLPKSICEDKGTTQGIRTLFMETLRFTSRLTSSTRRMISTANADCIFSRRAHPFTSGVA